MFGGGKPESIQANGYLTDTGVDELASVIIKYPGMLYEEVLAHNTLIVRKHKFMVQSSLCYNRIIFPVD